MDMNYKPQHFVQYSYKGDNSNNIRLCTVYLPIQCQFFNRWQHYVNYQCILFIFSRPSGKKVRSTKKVATHISRRANTRRQPHPTLQDSGSVPWPTPKTELFCIPTDLQPRPNWLVIFLRSQHYINIMTCVLFNEIRVQKLVFLEDWKLHSWWFTVLHHWLMQYLQRMNMKHST